MILLPPGECQGNCHSNNKKERREHHIHVGDAILPGRHMIGPPGQAINAGYIIYKYHHKNGETSEYVNGLDPSGLDVEDS